MIFIISYSRLNAKCFMEDKEKCEGRKPAGGDPRKSGHATQSDPEESVEAVVAGYQKKNVFLPGRLDMVSLPGRKFLFTCSGA